MERQKTATSLRWKIIDFTKTELSDETNEAMSLYFRDSFTTPNDIPDEQMGQFLDWYIHDYKLPDTGLTVLEHFFKKRAELQDIERFLTSGWLSSYNNCYQAVEVKPGYWLLLQDIITGENYLVANPELSEMTPPWSIFVGRIVPIGKIFELDFIHHTLPPTALTPLKELILSIYTNHSKGDISVSYKIFMQKNLSSVLARLVLEHAKIMDLSPREALTKELLPWKELFDWICTSFFGHNVSHKPKNFGKLIQSFKENDLFSDAFDRWPNGINAPKKDLINYLTWLEFIDTCLVIHYGKEPPFNFNSKALSLGLKKTYQPAFQPLSVTRTKINAESKALEKISSLLHTNMLKRYSDQQIEVAIAIWQHFLGQITEVPDIRNAGSWAGAVEYCLVKLLALPTTQKEIANVYESSTGSISRISSQIAKEIDLYSLDNDKFYSKE